MRNRKGMIWLAAACAVAFMISGAMSCSSAPAPGGGDEGWKLVRENRFGHAVNIVGFETLDFGVTGGYAGETHFSFDAGATWPRSEKVEALCRFGIDIIDKDTAITGGNGGMVLTTDGFHNWGIKNTSRFDIISFLSASTGWVSNKKAIFASSDGMVNVKRLNMPADFAKVGAVALYKENEGYFVDEKGTLYKTIDGGETWTGKAIKASAPGYEMLYNASFMRFLDEREGLVVVMAKKDEAVSYLGLRTHDGGKTWKSSLIGEGLGMVYISRNLKLVTLYLPLERKAALYSMG